MIPCAATLVFKIWCAASGWTDRGGWFDVGESLPQSFVAKPPRHSSSIPGVSEDLQFPGNPEVMLTQAIRQCRVSLGCSGVATTFSPDPLVEVRELNDR